MKSDNAVVNGTTFLVTDDSGRPTRAHDGVYHRDVRHLDRYELTTDRPLETLELTDILPGERVVETADPLDTGARSLRVRRRQFVTDSLVESLTIENLTGRPTTETLELGIGTRFDDLFEVRGHRPRRDRTITVDASEDGIVFGYDPTDHDFERTTTVAVDRPATVTTAQGEGRADGTIRVPVELDPHERTELSVVVSPARGSEPATAVERARTTVRDRYHDWADRPLPVADGRWEPVLTEARENLLELTLETEYGPVFAAGVPWFATVFGRDSVLTAVQTLEFTPTVAKATCRYLAAHQAEAVDDFRAAEPGKMLHEIRHGEAAARGEVPHSPYYGTVDATALFVVLVHQTWQATGDDAFARDLLPAVRRAITWLREYGDHDGDGFVDYPADPTTTEGLIHQAWKDSSDGIVHPDGSHPEGPLAVVEVQGYYYDALRRGAELTAAFGDDGTAETYDRAAESLRERFEDAFWLPEESFYAVALDGQGDPVRSITSNPGHCLWSGIVADSRADAVVDRLLADDLFTGWGIRTLSSTHDAYNPQSYHLGSVWPHDTSLSVLGMARYGRTDAVRQVTDGLRDAALARGNDRLPELFAGYAREDSAVPVTYGEACEPQAWAAGTPFACLRALSGEVSATQNPETPGVDPVSQD